MAIGNWVYLDRLTNIEENYSFVRKIRTADLLSSIPLGLDQDKLLTPFVMTADICIDSSRSILRVQKTLEVLSSINRSPIDVSNIRAMIRVNENCFPMMRSLTTIKKLESYDRQFGQYPSDNQMINDFHALKAKEKELEQLNAALKALLPRD